MAGKSKKTDINEDSNISVYRMKHKMKPCDMFKKKSYKVQMNSNARYMVKLPK